MSKDSRLIGLGVCLLLAFFILNITISTSYFKNLDSFLFKLINSYHPSEFFDFVMITISDYGRGFFWGSIMIVLWIFGKKKEKETVLILLITFLLLAIIGFTIKLFVQRPRPSASLDDVITLLQVGDTSFPSGHTLIVVAGAAITWFRLRKIFAFFLTIEAGLVAYSRICVGVHYPSDILGAILLGISSSCFIIVMYRRIDYLFEKLLKNLEDFLSILPKKFRIMTNSHTSLKIFTLGLAILFFFLFIEFAEYLVIQGKSLLIPELTAIFISFSSSISNTISSFGYIGVFILMLLEASSLPIPSEIVLPFAGYLVSKEILNFWLVVGISTLAAIIGSLIDYYIGYVLGVKFLPKIGKYFFIKEEHLRFAEKWFEKHGSKAVFICRLIPAIRTLISIVAGTAKMNMIKFLVYTTFGCLIWNIILVYLGVYLGIHWHQIVSFSEYVIVGIFVVSLIFMAWLVWLKRHKNNTNI